MIPVIAINLKRYPDRRARITERLDALKIPFQIFDAIDGSALSKEELDTIAPAKRWLRSARRRPALPGEVGCALSHLEAVRAYASHEFFCLLEDDSVPLPSVLKFLDPTALRALPKFDALRLYTPPEILQRRIPMWELARVGDHGISVMLVLGASTCAQIYSRSGAAKIVSTIMTINAPIDEMLYRNPEISGFRVLNVIPSVATDKGEAVSTIGQRAEFAPTSPAAKLARSVLKIPRRLKLIWHFARTWVFSGVVPWGIRSER